MFVCEKHYSCCNHQYWDRWDDVEQDAKECGHLIEVAEVRHGRWEALGEKFVNCTHCGTIFETLPTIYCFERNNIFCRHCGAKMDLEG